MPDRTTLERMTKKRPAGAVYLDWVQVGKGKTLVAPFSVRARDGAPVSMPVNWNQVRDGLDPSRFTVRSVPGLLAKSKAWTDYCDAERPLEGAIRKLVAAKR